MLLKPVESRGIRRLLTATILSTSGESSSSHMVAILSEIPDAPDSDAGTRYWVWSMISSTWRPQLVELD